jgi:hypothetical protein
MAQRLKGKIGPNPNLSKVYSQNARGRDVVKHRGDMQYIYICVCVLGERARGDPSAVG